MLSYTWKNSFLSNYFKTTTSIKRVRIVSAFFSEYGLNLLKQLINNNKLDKENIEICLSAEFASKDAVKLLESLSYLATTYIVFKNKLHAKAYLFEKKDGQLEFIHGSANFTQGGFKTNLELVTLQQNSDIPKVTIHSFFDYCKNQGELVTEEVIEFYRENEQVLRNAEESQQRVQKKLREFVQREDLIQESDYNLEEYYFNYQDYETFFPRNVSIKTNEIKQRRLEVKKKMLALHSALQPYMKNLNLHPHWNANNVTSLIEPSHFNHHRVSWLGIRYGKKSYEVQELNKGLEKSWNKQKQSFRNDETMGFQKHACIQFSISGDKFEIILFHAVAHDAVDRMHVWGLIDEGKYEVLQNITQEIENLKGKGFVWYITDARNDTLIDKFEIDKRDATEFLKFYKENDQPGYESFCSYKLSPNDEVMKNKKEIVKLVLRKTKQLLPLYKIMTFRISNQQV